MSCTGPRSSPDPLGFGIIERLELNYCRVALPSDFHFPAAAGGPIFGHAVLVAHIAQSERSPNPVPPGAARGRADEHAVPIDRLLVIDHRSSFGVVDERETDETFRLDIALSL